MTTKRETILARIATVLTGTTGVSDRIYRSRVTALQRSETPSIIFEPQSDSVEQTTSLPTLDHTLPVRISVIVRSDPPHTTAHPTVENMHSRLMADLTLNGNAIDIQPRDTRFDFVDADVGGLVTEMEYDIRYRTQVADLSQ